MQVRLDSYYSIAEVDDLLAALVTAELLTGPEVKAAEQAKPIKKYTLNLFTVNNLLRGGPVETDSELRYIELEVAFKLVRRAIG